MKQLRVLIVTLCAMTMAVPAFADEKGSTAPGKYSGWGPDIDEIEIVQTFDFSDYDKVVVNPFDTSATPLPDSDDNTYEPVKKVLASSTEGFVQGLRGSVDADVTMSEASKGAGTLIIRVKVDEMAPGSKAARYFAGFGAGAARAKLSGEIVDGATGKVLVRFTQERRSGVGMMGGDYQELMQRNLNAIGEDVANLLEQF